jgi:hypothetical protein
MDFFHVPYGDGIRREIVAVEAHASPSSGKSSTNVPFGLLYRSGMPKFLIEREIPGAGDLSRQQLQAISEKSCSVLRNLGPEIQWVHSYVTGDKIYCVYIAPNEQMIREHARLGGFPANTISEIKTVIDPSTAEKS